MTVDLRLAIPAAAGWVAAAVLVGAPQAAVPALVAAWLVAGALVIFRPRVALVAAAIALCCTSVAVHAPAREPPMLVDAATRHLTVTAVATATQTVQPGRGSFEVQLESVSGSALSVPALVFGEGQDSRLGIGTKIALEGTVTRADAGDDRAFLFFPLATPRVLDSPPWYLDWANELRAEFLRATQELPGDGGDLLAGLAIGDTSAVSDNLDAAMKASALRHNLLP